MLTPSFDLIQNDKSLVITIKAPLANIAQTELVVDGNEVIFYASPYFLRLNLPGEVTEVENEYGKFDADTGKFTFVLQKVVYGEHFKDLDLISKLLIPAKKHQVKPSIQVCDEILSDSEDEEDWYHNQEIILESRENIPSYGFANKMNGHDQSLRVEFAEIVEFTDLELPLKDRNILRKKNEKEKFSEDHYLADLMENDFLDELLSFESPWSKIKEAVLSEDEKNYLKNLGNRDYIMSSHEKKLALLSLVDIIFAYAYNCRTTMDEKDNAEAAWTINKLSSTLSWFNVYDSIRDVNISCVRRSLIYPLYRNWDLSMEILRDTISILKLGRRQILKCLIEIHKMFNASEPRYLLNLLYITDYCIWIQKISEKKITQLASYLEQETISKADVELDLSLLEQAAYFVLKEEVGDLSSDMKKLNVE